MAYNVSDKFRERVYSGGAVYKCHLTINGTPISPTIISKITINDPIIDTTSQSFYIGSFISKQLTIKFKNVEQLGLQIESGQNVELSIGAMVDNVEEVVPIGKFIIDELGENYYKDCEIICNDYAIKFKPNVDYSPCFVNGKATIDTILEYICTYFEVELDENYPKTNGNVEIGSYDNTLSGKQYISYIAEIKGCNAKIGRDGRLYLIPLNNVPITQIQAKKSKSITLGERYELTNLIFDNGITKIEKFRPSNYQTSLLLTEDENLIITENGDNIIANEKANTVYIRSDNLFVLGTYPNGSTEDIIDNIFEVVKNFEIYTLTNENFGDISLDSYDIVSYKIDNDTYNTFYNSTLTYEMNIMGKIEVTIPTKQQEITTNITKGDEKTRIRRLETNYDTINNEMVLKATDDGNIALVKIGATAERGSKFNVKADNIDFAGKSFNVTTEQMKIQIGVGANVKDLINTSGVLTNLVYDGYVRGNLITGSGDYIPLGRVGGGNSVENQANAMAFSFDLPKNFNVLSAKIHLYHVPINWETLNIVGSSQNLKIFQSFSNTSMKMNVNLDTGAFYTSGALMQEIENSWENQGTTGFNGSKENATYISSVELKDIIKVNEENYFEVKDATNIYYGDNATIFEKTGGVFGYIEIIGYTQI